MSEQGDVATPSEHAAAPGIDSASVDLDAVARDLDGVERALARLDDGTYWTDELTGEPISDELLARAPTRRTSIDQLPGPR